MTGTKKEFQIYLQPTEFIDSDSQEIIEFARSSGRNKNSEIDIAVALFYAVRDGVRYDPYKMDLSKHGLKASTVLERRYGFCVPKAILLAAAGRAMGIPARLGFADVKNHLNSKRLYEKMRTNVFVYHAFTEMYIEDKWVKATPAFNLSLCEMAGVKPLDFDGENDSLFQQFDQKGNRHMEYIKYRGSFPDVPYAEMVTAFQEAYPHVIMREGIILKGDFERETETDIN